MEAVLGGQKGYKTSEMFSPLSCSATHCAGCLFSHQANTHPVCCVVNSCFLAFCRAGDASARTKAGDDMQYANYSIYSYFQATFSRCVRHTGTDITACAAQALSSAVEGVRAVAVCL